MDRLSTQLKSLLLLGALFAVSGCASHTPYQGSSTAAAVRRAAVNQSESAQGGPVAELALAMIGRPYVYGGADPAHGFDCSGLVFYTYAENGLSVPRTSQELFKASRKIALAQANQGDLVFFQDQEKLSHVGIYLGDGLFVHAPSSGKRVSIANLAAPYYQQHLVAVGSLLAD